MTERLLVNKSRLTHAFFILLACISALFVLFPSSPANMNFSHRDSGVFLYTGWRMLNGEAPYVDVWDHKPPVIYFINALGLALSGGARSGVWLIEFISLLLAALICLCLLGEVFGILPAVFGLCLLVVNLVQVLEGGNLATEYALLFQFGCLWLFFNAEKRGIYSWRGFLMGVMCEIAFLAKQNTIGVGLACTLYIFIRKWMQGNKTELVAPLMLILGGGISVIIVLLVYLYSQGAIKDFWDEAFIFNLVYSSSDLLRHIRSVVLGLARLSRFGLTQFAVMGWGAGLIWRYFNREEIDDVMKPILTIALIGFPIELVLVSVPGQSFAHYYITLLPVFVILASFFYWMFIKGLTLPQIPPKTAPLFTVFILFVLLISQGPDYLGIVRSYRRLEMNYVLHYIENSTSENDYVLVWGSEAAINFFARRRSPTRYVYQFPPLYTRGYTNRETIEEFLGDIEVNKPKLIIGTTGIAIWENHFGFTSSRINQALEFMKSHYRIKEQVSDWTMYFYDGAE